ncbi:hypothetical protein C4D60_Mb07t10320 [Musa balbisiana]|uniref:Response regulatory domain-containing protein n=1 Tax=Musa balbisiana TaxID=52838 RepID=A0A4S8JEA9_MUSBA|nr:hypothetical protein C4D60_Mb07t10320 [Musa balbisiana]
MVSESVNARTRFPPSPLFKNPVKIVSRRLVTAVDSAKKALELLGTESPKLREIPVVIMSSENDPDKINRCLEEGAEDFLLKPVRPSDVSRLCGRMRS